MAEKAESRNKSINWGLHEQAESFLLGQMELFRNRFGYADNMITNIEHWTGTRLIDWMDHMVLSEERFDADDLSGRGYVQLIDAESQEGDTIYHCPGSMLPPLILRKSDETVLALKAESLDMFKKKNDIPGSIHGIEFGPYRYLQVAVNANDMLVAVERRGYNGFVVTDEGDPWEYAKTLDSFRRRNRDYSCEEDGYSELEDMIKDMKSTLDTNSIADAFFRVDREFWCERNEAGQFQKERQQAFGLGWANHDHHAYRSSRKNFPRLIRILELLGMETREAFYAGKQAGWGAQVMENRTCGTVVFADVDMSPEERGEDFAHRGFKPRDQLGTIGLWVGLHGESMLQAGLHHLAIRCVFQHLKADYEEERVGVMTPFSDFPFLKQAFTRGEPWIARDNRTIDLFESKMIDQEQYDRFRETAVIGSHVEIIERNSGFAGFNQDSVSVIIKATDPRRGMVREA